MSGKQVRPRRGSIEHSDGTSTPVWFVDTENPQEYEAWDEDLTGPVVLQAGDVLRVDVIGPGQSVRIVGHEL